MARIAGIELNDKWRLEYALTKIRGIGFSLSKEIMKNLKYDLKTRISDLNPEDISRLTAKAEEFTIEGDLSRKVRGDIKRLQAIGSYRGTRHSRGLPVHGQRTKSNARTKRGKRKTVGAFKKEALAKATASK